MGFGLIKKCGSTLSPVGGYQENSLAQRRRDAELCPKGTFTPLLVCAVRRTWPAFDVKLANLSEFFGRFAWR